MSARPGDYARRDIARMGARLDAVVREHNARRLAVRTLWTQKRRRERERERVARLVLCGLVPAVLALALSLAWGAGA